MRKCYPHKEVMILHKSCFLLCVHCVLCAILFTILLSCSAINTDIEKTSELTSLNGKTYTLKITRSVTLPQVTSPFQELKESDYVMITDGKNYTVSFLADGSGVTLEPGNIRGVKADSKNDSLRFYNLTIGVFAGGRFQVWSNKTGFEAELTLYGSGLPIILSERGNLISVK